MKRVVLFIFCVLFFKVSFSINPGNELNNLNFSNEYKLNLSLNNNYQQFKFQVINFEPSTTINYANLKKRKKSDHLMLYVAGGLAVATVTLILTNNPENFTTNSASGVNLGIAAGGTIACGLIVAKYFIDKGR